MIKFTNNYSFEYMTASGAMGYDGRGWTHEQPLRWLGLLDVSLFPHVMKTITSPPREGNFRWWKPWDCIRFIWEDGKIVGVANAFGLTNPGINWWIKTVGPKLDSSKIPLVGSIFGEPRELAKMAGILNDFDLVGLEVNASCPNTDDDTLSNSDRVIQSCAVVAESSRHPVVLKVSVVHDIEKIMPAVRGMVEAVSVNSVPWHIAFRNRQSPLAKYGGGGVSGKIAQPFTWAFAERLKSITDIPVIAPSVWDYEDIGTLRAKGFGAFSFGSVFLPHPCRPTSYVRKNKREILANIIAFTGRS